MLTIKGIKRICGETKSLKGYYSPEYLELFYNIETGESWTNYQYSIGHNTWTEYHDPHIIKIRNLCEPCTIEQIKKFIEDGIENNVIF